MRPRVIPLCPLLFACLTHSFGQDPKPECPSIDVIGPAGITLPGEKFKFSGAVEGNVPEKVSYRWETSGGKIIEGQGTLKISLESKWTDAGITIVATLTVTGLPIGCPNSASEAAGITGTHNPILIDEFGRLANNRIRTRLNKFFTELSNNPTNQEYIIIYDTEREVTARERLIVDEVSFRHFDRSRVTIVRGGTHEIGKVFTKLYRVPPGADNPAP